MNLRDLKYLVALADHCHFGKAAESCFVSQPTLSMQIKKMEETLNVQLIERNNKKVLLTESGKLITTHAKDILYQLKNIENIAKQAQNPFSGELYLGIIPTLSPYLLPHIISKLIEIFPKLTIYLIEERTSVLLEKLHKGELDGALLATEEKDFFAMPLFQEEFVLATPVNHPLTKQKKINLSDLENHKLLLLEDGHCLRNQIISICQKQNISELKGFRATSLETLKHMVASNVGITLVPKLACKENDNICYLPFDTPKPVRTIEIIWRPSIAKKILLENIAAQIKKLMIKQKIVDIIL